MADKLTQQITDGLARAAAHAAGLLLYASKTESGLFPNTAAGKLAAQKCLADGFIRVSDSEESQGKASRELYCLTDAGWDFLLAQVNPKQVLEDFVRVLEERRGEVGELLDTARSMAASLQGLKDAVSRVLPAVSTTRVPQSPTFKPRLFSHEPHSCGTGLQTCESRHTGLKTRATNHVAVLDADAEADADLAPLILAGLTDWRGAAGEDCTLPELFRYVSLAQPTTIGQFHDSLRQLCADGAIALHSWTGPLYAMPEPAYALMNGHGVAYYCSLKSGQWTVDSGQ